MTESANHNNSVSSSGSHRMAAMFANGFFPRSGSIDNGTEPATRARPTAVSAACDPEAASIPLAKFSDIYDRAYRENGSHAGVMPAGLKDGDYLYPVLTRNEHLRLTMLWYYTQGLAEDHELLARLQVKIDLLKEFIDWDIAILGIVENHAFERLVTHGIDQARVPRRESTCSHTVQSTAPGEVFMVPNLAEDWRFKHSPPVHDGGVRSYAGTVLRCQVPGGDTVALGSLCVASTTPDRSLSKSQSDVLVRFSDMIMSEIINAQRLNRRKAQQEMNERVARAMSAGDVEEVEAAVMAILAETYPSAQVEVRDVQAAQDVQLDHGRSISLSETQDGLWEDSSFIDHLITTGNHKELKPDRIIRAVVTRFWSHPTLKVLLVLTDEITQVFDDIDASFVGRCSAILSNAAQERSLRTARVAREQFLRGIAHQLRTPIHGVLGSVELLTEELGAKHLSPNGSLVTSTITPNARNTVSVSGEVGDQINANHVSANATAALKTIQNSGRDLMSTVDNMIKLIRWTDMVEPNEVRRLRDLSHFEVEILEETTKMLPDDEVERLCIFFDNELPDNANSVMMDVALVKECLQPVLLNAFQYTSVGCVIISLSLSEDGRNLCFEVKDTGCGIRSENTTRIFEAYEKEDAHGRGAGLGLTLAAKSASAMNGTLQLVQSTPGLGSTFRITYRDPGLACQLGPTIRRSDVKFSKTITFGTISAEPASYTHQHFVKFLQRRGLELSASSDVDVMIVSFSPLAETFKKHLEAVVDFQGTVVCLLPAKAKTAQLEQSHSHISFLTGPFTTERLDEILTHIRDSRSKAKSSSSARRLSSPSATTFDARLPEPSPALVSPAAVQELTHGVSSTSLSAAARNKLIPRTLLVDDNLINLRIIRLYCEKRRLPHRCVIDGVEAVDAFTDALDEGRPFHLILLDLQMPRCDGAEACERIRKIEEERGGPRAAVFMITGQDSARDKARAFAAGADEFYVKPMGLKALDRAVGQYFDMPN